MTNRCRGKEIEQSPNVTKEIMSRNNLPLILDLTDNYGKIVLNKNLFSLQHYFVQMIPVQAARSSTPEIERSNKEGHLTTSNLASGS